MVWHRICKGFGDVQRRRLNTIVVLQGAKSTIVGGGGWNLHTIVWRSESELPNDRRRKEGLEFVNDWGAVVGRRCKSLVHQRKCSASDVETRR